LSHLLASFSPRFSFWSSYTIPSLSCRLSLARGHRYLFLHPCFSLFYPLSLFLSTRICVVCDCLCLLPSPSSVLLSPRIHDSISASDTPISLKTDVPKLCCCCFWIAYYFCAFDVCSLYTSLLSFFSCLSLFCCLFVLLPS
jgi:hypothetical protein